MRHLKIFLTGICLFVLLFASHAKGGIGAEISYIHPNPNYEMGYALKPAPGFALFLRPLQTTYFRLGVSLGFVPFKTAQDVFVTSTVSDNIIETQEQWFKNNSYNYFYVALQPEYKILKTAVSPVIGVDFRINLASYTTSTTMTTHYIAQDETRTDVSYDELVYDASMSLVPKIGVAYDLEQVSFLLTGGYNWDIYPRNKYPYFTVSLAVTYNF